MKKNIVFVVLILITGIIAFNMGKMYAVNNALVTNKSHDSGNYEMLLGDETYYYYYEEMKGE